MLPTEALQETLYRFLAQMLACSNAKLFCTISCSQTKQPAQDIGLSTEAPTTETSEKETWPEQVHSLRDHDELSPCTEMYLNVLFTEYTQRLSLSLDSYLVPHPLQLWAVTSKVRHQAQ